MKRHTIKDFEHFLMIEQKNLFHNISGLEKDYDLILDLDRLYLSSLNVTLPEDSNIMIPAFLYLISHQEFYYGMASFLRLHKTQALRCLRVALDSTFTAYYLLKNPEETDSYLQKKEDVFQWEKLFRNIKMTIRNTQNKFPLVVGLTEVHDFCSKFAHADPDGIFHKYYMDIDKKILRAEYFDYDKNHDEYKKWFVFFLFYFFRIFMIYWNSMLKNSAGGMRKEIAGLTKDFRNRIDELRKKYPLPDLPRA
ncbi:MAG: hypothetical protein L6290_08375 [Thermodesulfovibrionales bacterium]|nr:hypothetical protein [Thermodesulfovibrionales bacterium]